MDRLYKLRLTRRELLEVVKALQGELAECDNTAYRSDGSKHEIMEISEADRQAVQTLIDAEHKAAALLAYADARERQDAAHERYSFMVYNGVDAYRLHYKDDAGRAEA